MESEGKGLKNWVGGDRIRDRNPGQKQPFSAKSYQNDTTFAKTQVVNHK
jgi:hypothetical protein